MAFVQNHWTIFHAGPRAITSQVQRDNHALGRKGYLDQLFADLSPVPLVERHCEVKALDLFKDLDLFINLNSQLKTKIEQILGICFQIEDLLRDAIEPDFPSERRLAYQGILESHVRVVTEQTLYSQYCRTLFDVGADPLRFLFLSVETMEKTAASRVELQSATLFLQDCLDTLKAEIREKESQRDSLLETTETLDSRDVKSLFQSTQPDFYSGLINAKGATQPQVLARSAAMIQRLLEKN